MSEHIVGVRQYRLKGPRLRFEPETRPIPLNVTEEERSRAIKNAQNRLSQEKIIYTAETLLDIYGDEKLKFQHLKDLRELMQRN